MSARGRFLLDTNIVIALLGGEEAVLSNLDQALEVFVPPLCSANCSSEPRNPAGLMRTQPNWNNLL